jgi:hypothetical protein
MKAQVRPRWISGIAVVSLIALIAMTLGVAIVHGKGKDGKEKGEHVRWDLIVLTPVATVNAGGQASALNNIGDQITFTGTGTFVAPAGRGKTSDAVTGGGTWTIVTAGGSSTGTYIVTGLVRWEEAPGSFPAAADNIGNPVDFRSGLAVLSIEYSDGSHGILVVSCHGAGTPDTVFEGITASKDFVDYWNRVPPSGTPTGPNANRTSFHIVQRESD